MVFNASIASSYADPEIGTLIRTGGYERTQVMSQRRPSLKRAGCDTICRWRI